MAFRSSFFTSSGGAFVRVLFFFLPLSAAAWAAGCSDDAPADPGGDVDSGTDTSVPVQTDTGAPDTNTTPKRDCKDDLEADGIWKHLECSGIYESFGDKKIAADVKPYKPGVELWSDGAEKSRFIYLPPNEKIDTSDFNEWVFPAGTKVWKEFKVGGKRIETRLFTKLQDKSWVHTSYRWTADETDAVRKDGGEKIPGIGKNGAIYEVPGTGQCDECHQGRRDQILGFDAVSLGLPTATGQTLATLATEGKLSVLPPKTTLTFPEDATGEKSSKAIGWANINCGPCHNDNPNARAAFAAHFLVRATQLAPTEGGAPATVQDLDIYKTAYCKPAGRLEPADAGADAGGFYLYIRGAEPTRSLMSVLSGQRAVPPDEPSSTFQMPPLVTRVVDEAGHQQLVDWIAALPPCP